MLNIVKVPKLEVNVYKMLPASEKAGLQPALLPPHDDVRLFLHAQKWPAAT